MKIIKENAWAKLAYTEETQKNVNTLSNSDFFKRINPHKILSLVLFPPFVGIRPDQREILFYEVALFIFGKSFFSKY